MRSGAWLLCGVWDRKPAGMWLNASVHNKHLSARTVAAPQQDEHLRRAVQWYGHVARDSERSVHSVALIVFAAASLASRKIRAGLIFDRNWVIVAADSHKFITQRTTPMMSQVATSLPEAALLLPSVQAVSHLPHDAALTLEYPGLPSLQVPLNTAADLREGASATSGDLSAAVSSAKVWEWAGPVLDEGNAAADWLSEALKRNVRCAGAASKRCSCLSFVMTRGLVKVSAQLAMAMQCHGANAFALMLTFGVMRHAFALMKVSGAKCRLVRHMSHIPREKLAELDSQGSVATPGGGSGSSGSVADAAKRLCDPDFAANYETIFQDGFPLTFVSEVRSVPRRSKCDRGELEWEAIVLRRSPNALQAKV